MSLPIGLVHGNKYVTVVILYPDKVRHDAIICLHYSTLSASYVKCV